MRGSFLQRLLQRPWARALAIIGSYLLALQAAGLPRLTQAEAASCCCAHKITDCACKVCSHKQELESGAPTIKSCGSAGGFAVVATALDDALPAVQGEPPAVSHPPLPQPLNDSQLPDPAREVPTPPPLARS
jgi:hypothetical protein